MCCCMRCWSGLGPEPQPARDNHQHASRTRSAFAHRRHLPALTTCGVCKCSGPPLWVQERPDSDVDLLVEFIPGQAPGGFGLVDMQDELVSTPLAAARLTWHFRQCSTTLIRRRAIEPQLQVALPMNFGSTSRRTSPICSRFVCELRSLDQGPEPQPISANKPGTVSRSRKVVHQPRRGRLSI